MKKRSFMYACICATAIAGALLVPIDAQAATISVPAGGDLQAALNAARPGDTILLAAGATYVGNFTLPVHGGTTYVTIRTGGNDTLLPGAGKRITPAHAQYLAKIRSPNTWPAIATAPRAAYWRIMFVEFLATQYGADDVMYLGDASPAQNALSLVPHHLIVDRVYIHGDRLVGQKRGIFLNTGQVSVVNCHISGIKAVGQDSQAIGIVNGPGPFLIENNYLESSAQMFQSGGSDPKIPGLVPADLTFRGNVLTRPVSWRNPIMPTPTGVSAVAGAGGSLAAGTYAYHIVARRPSGGFPIATMATSVRSAEATVTLGATGGVTVRWNAVQDATEYRVYGRTPGGQTMYWTVGTTVFTDTGAAGTAGTPPTTGTVWQVKNLFELKNLRRAQIDNNLMENNWLSAQNGIAVLFTTRNQDGGCTQCIVEDVTFEYNTVRNVAGGINILGIDNRYPSGQANNIRIRNNIFSGIDRVLWGGTGYFLSVTNNPRDITVDHNTIISPNGQGVVTVAGPPVYGFVFTNNVARHNSYGIFGNGMGYGNAAINYYFPNGVIRRNVFAGGQASMYPPDNLFPTTASFEAHFVNYAGGDYALAPGTDWARAGLDAEDLGADVAQVRSGAGSAVLHVVTQSLPSTTELAAYAYTLQASGGNPPYRWSIVSGSLPSGISLNSLTGALSGAAATAGNYGFTVRTTDASAATASQPLTLQVAAPVSNKAPVVTLSASRSGVIPVGAPVTITANATDTDGNVVRVEFLKNGVLALTDTSAPFSGLWIARAGGPYTFSATATDDGGAKTTSAPLALKTTSEIVIYASEAKIVGDFQLVADATAAGGWRLWNPNRFAPRILSASASPASYAEFTFYAEQGRAYHLWIRGKGESNLWSNDSAYLQFSGTVDAAGAAVSRIGTTGSIWYSVEEYVNAGLSYWGWQDSGNGAPGVLGSPLYFATTGRQTLRIQPREDGLSIDQIVISPSKYLSTAPGLPKSDSTIIPKLY